MHFAEVDKNMQDQAKASEAEEHERGQNTNDNINMHVVTFKSIKFNSIRSIIGKNLKITLAKIINKLHTK